MIQQKDSFSSGTMMFLANALYFNEKWLQPFEDKDYTGNPIKEFFYTNDGKIKVPMIQQISSKIVYGEIETQNDLLEVVTIPYENKDFEMQIILPKDVKGLNILEDQMKLREEQDDNSNFNLFKALKNVYSGYIEDIQLRMPKFKLKSKFNAADILKNLGKVPRVQLLLVLRLFFFLHLLENRRTLYLTDPSSSLCRTGSITSPCWWGGSRAPAIHKEEIVISNHIVGMP